MRELQTRWARASSEQRCCERHRGPSLTRQHLTPNEESSNTYDTGFRMLQHWGAYGIETSETLIARQLLHPTQNLGTLHLHPNGRLPVPLLALSGKQKCQRTTGQAQKAKAGILQLCPLYALKPPRSMQNNANTTKLVDAFFRVRPDAPDGALHSTDYVMPELPSPELAE